MREHFKRLVGTTVSFAVAVSGNIHMAYAAAPCFTGLPQSTGVVAGVAGGAATVVAADTSTTQILELVAERREKQTNQCPTGYVSVGGACEPIAQTAAASEPTSPPPQAKSSSSASKPKSSTAKKSDAEPAVIESDASSPGPQVKGRSNGAWVQGFADYEERDGLAIAGANNIERTQRTAGLLAGGDLTHKLSSDSGVLVGLLGGYANNKQKFSSINSSGTVSTPFPFFYDTDFNDIPDHPTPAAVFDFDVPHDFSAKVEQETDSGSAGTYAAYFKGGFFLDGLFKVDFNRLKRTTSGTDTFARTLTLNGGVNLNAVAPGAGGVNPDGSVPTGVPTGGVSVGPNQGAAEAGINGGQVAVDSEGNACFNGGGMTAPVFSNVSADAYSFGQSTSYQTFTWASNIGYRYDLSDGFFFEPTGTVTFSYSNYNGGAAALGLDDGHTLRLQGGGRIGKIDVNASEGYVWTTAVGAYLYSDVVVDGFTINNGLSGGALEQDQGELRVLGTLDAEIAWLSGFSLYTQGQVRVGDDYWGIGGKLGGRIEW